MENLIHIDAGADTEATSEGDIRAMLSMIDYLIARTGQIDEMSTRLLVMARQSLAALATHPRRH